MPVTGNRNNANQQTPSRSDQRNPSSFQLPASHPEVRSGLLHQSGGSFEVVSETRRGRSHRARHDEEEHPKYPQDRSASLTSDESRCSGTAQDLSKLVDLFKNLQTDSQETMGAMARQLNRPDMSHIPKFDGQTSFTEHVAILRANYKIKAIPVEKWNQYLFESIKSDLHLWLIDEDKDHTLMSRDFESVCEQAVSRKDDLKTQKKSIP